MKILVHLFLFLFIGLYAGAQNWQLIPEDQPLFFKHPSSGKNIGLETVRKKTRSGSLVYELSASVAAQQEDPVWMDREELWTILGRIVVVTSNGDTWLKDSTMGDSILVRTLAKTGDKWILNPKEAILAEVVSMFSANIKGQSDSVKLVQLSNGQQLVLSKANGLWSSPNLFPDENGGTLKYDRTEDERLTFKDVYDFDVGDVFHSKKSKGSPYVHTNFIDTITNKQVVEGEVRYTISRVAERVIQASGPETENKREVSRKVLTKSYPYSDELLFKALPNTLFSQPDSLRGLMKDTMMTYFLYDSSSLYTVPFVRAGIAYGWDYRERFYISGAGAYYYNSYEATTAPDYHTLLYFKKKDVEWGEKIFIGKKDAPVKSLLSIYPNPAQGQLQVSGLEQTQAARIVDVSGKVHQNVQLRNGTLDISALAPGSYVLALDNGQNIFFSVL